MQLFYQLRMSSRLCRHAGEATGLYMQSVLEHGNGPKILAVNQVLSYWKVQCCWNYCSPKL